MPTEKIEKLWSFFLVFAISAMPVLAVLAPRALGLVPAILGLLLFLAHRLTFKNWPHLNRAFGFAAGLIVALAAISSLWAFNADIAVERALKLFIILLGNFLLFSTICAAPRRATGLFSNILPWAVVLAGALCCFELYSGGALYQILHPDIEIFNPAALNRGTVFYVLCFWPALYLTKAHAPKASHIVKAVLIVFLAAILLKTDSQSAQLAFFVSLPFYLFFPAGRAWSWWVFGGGLVAAIAFSPWIAFGLFEHVTPLILDIEWFQQSFAANRTEIWNFVAKRALEQPILGHGIEATRSITDFESQRLYHSETTILHPHNFALQIWIEFGALGILFFGGMIAFALAQLSKIPVQNGRLYMAFFTAALSVGATGYGLWQSWWIGALCVCVALCFWANMARAQ